jgi:hypothetical protein
VKAGTPQRVLVGARVDGPVAHLLGRHVPGRAREAAFGRQPHAGVLHQPRDAEVEHLHVHAREVAPHAHVLRLHVPVHDAALVREVQHLGHLERDAPRFLEAEPRLGADELAQVHALDELEHQEDAQRLVAPEVQHLRRPRVPHFEPDARLAEEARHPRVVRRRLGVEELHRDVVAHAELLREEDEPHAALPQALDEPVAARDDLVGQRQLHRGGGRGHGKCRAYRDGAKRSRAGRRFLPSPPTPGMRQRRAGPSLPRARAARFRTESCARRASR